MTPDGLPVGVSGRVLDRHVGGNTTYARRVYDRLGEYGVATHVLRPPGSATVSSKLRSLEYLAYESSWIQIRADSLGLRLLHYPADTGPLAKIADVPIVITVHGAAALHEPDIRSKRATRIWVQRTRRAIRLADVVITVSDSSANDIVELARPHPVAIEVIPHGVDHDCFRPATDHEIDAAHSRHGVQRPFVLYVGNLEPRKNLIALVAAVDALNAAGKDLELLVGGKPAWDAEPTIAAVAASHNARRLGWVEDSDLRGLMSSCELFAFPSLYEGFGMPVIEAMACGAPVMCTPRGSLPEVAGGVATYATGTDAGPLAQAILSCLERPRHATRVEGIARAAQHRWDFSARRHHEVFRSLT